MANNITQAESSGNPIAKNPNSSALGLGQFVDGTWLDMIRRYRPDLAQGKSRAEILELRKDPVLSTQMTDAYAAENTAKLDLAGLPVTPGTTYLMHFAGPSGGIALMKADPNTPVESILNDQAIKANPFLQGKTASGVIAWANKTIATAAASKSRVAPQPAWGEGKPVPYLAETKAAEPAFGATGWPPRPGSPNVWPADGAKAMFGARTSAPVPYLDETNMAQRLLQRVPSQGLPPAAFNGRFNQAPLSSADVDRLLAAVNAGREGDKTKPSLEPSPTFADRFGSWNSVNGASGPARTSGNVLGQTSDNDGLGPRAPQFAQTSTERSQPPNIAPEDIRRLTSPVFDSTVGDLNAPPFGTNAVFGATADTPSQSSLLTPLPWRPPANLSRDARDWGMPLPFTQPLAPPPTTAPNAPGGLLRLFLQSGVVDPSNPEQPLPPAGGLVGRLLQAMHDNPDGFSSR